MRKAIAIYESGAWRPVKPLSEEDAATLLDAIKALHKFESDHSAFVIANANAEQYLDSIERHVERIDKRQGYHPYELHLMAADANRHACNFLSSFSAFLNQSERIICDQFGNDSEHRKVFKGECSKIYDSSQAYRLLYAFRNFAQHYAMPITGLKGGLGAAGSATQVRVGFHPSDLLSSGFDWKSNDRRELESMVEFVDLTPLILEVRDKLKYLFAVQLSICAAPYLSRAEILEPYITEIGVSADKALIVSTDMDGSPTTVESDWIPATTVRRLIESKKRVT